MNWLDLIILLLLVAAVARGLMHGGVLQILPFVGFLGGLWIGAAFAPVTARIFEAPFQKALASMLTVFGAALLLSAVGQGLGMAAHRAIRRVRLGPLDAAAGVAISMVVTLLAVWVFAAMFSALPSNPFAKGFQDSVVVRALVAKMPPAPTVFSRIRALVDTTGFPEVFAGLEPAADDQVDLPADPLVRAAVDAAGASTVKIVGIGCGGIKTGSGFVAAENLVVTNAHVVSGIRRVSVEDGRGSHTATPVLFDPGLDVAVLRTSGLAGPPLPFFTRPASRGTGGAVLGFPEGGPFRADGGAVLRQIEAVGRDIYGRDLTRRQVYQLQAQVRQGNSGGPFVLQGGEVVGVIFSASASDPSISYALVGSEVAPRVGEASERREAVSTQEC